jgi:hypothetical protein
MLSGHKKIFMAVLWVCLSPACANLGNSPPVSTSVCDVQPSLNGSFVISGIFATDKMHIAVLMDPSCIGTNYGVGLADRSEPTLLQLREIPSALEAGPGVERFSVVVQGHFTKDQRYSGWMFWIERALSIKRLK